ARNQYERMGSDVTMQCGTLDNDASVSWKVNGTDVKAQHHLEGPRLMLNEVDLGHNGLYSCFQNPHGERRDTIYLHIGIPPREPTVTCRSNTYPKGFYCSWHQLHPTYIPTTFEVDVQHNQRSLEVQKDPDHKNRCRVRFPEVFSSFPYKVNVTAVNALGKASSTISFEESSIVKPDPPERVTATPIRFNARRLEVELSDSTSHNITDAYAGKEYIIQVAAKDTEIGTWSDWSVAVHATPWIEDPLPITSTTEGDFSTVLNPDLQQQHEFDIKQKFFRGTFESGILIITNNNNSSSNRSSNNHNNSNDISINSLILPPGGFDGPQQTLFGRQQGIFGATPQMMKKNLLINFLFLFFH
ncbi:Ciliary neurotrophic factor receptor subunit alpha, partial [Larimichthys crocea]